MTNYWKDGATGNWFVAANWSEGKVPQDYGWDSVVAGTSDNATVTINAAQANSTNFGTLTVATNATLNVTATSSDASTTVFNTNQLTVNQGGTMNIATSNTVNLGSNTLVNGTLKISDNPTILTSSDNVTGSGTLILDGSTLGSTNNWFQMDSSLTTVLQNGASLYVNNAVAGKAITFGSDATNGKPNHLLLTDNKQTVTTPITGYDATSVITIAKRSYAAAKAAFTKNADGTYTLTTSTNPAGSTITLSNISFAAGYEAGTPTVIQNADGSWSIVNGSKIVNASKQVCYLAGTMLLTPQGERAIETLEAGDQITIYKNGTTLTQTILRVGRAHAKNGSTGHADLDGVPVRVRAGALADGVPSRDLLVTPEHCMMLEGGFIPVRMLVNGMSIAYDHAITEYDYYHVETEQHSVLIANGALSESFLDVGHRPDALMQGNTLTRLHALSWEKDAALPLITDRARVEPLFAALALRAKTLGYTAPQAAPSKDETNQIHLILQDETVLYPIRTRGEQFVFMLPEGCQTARIISPAARPADHIGPFVDDRRTLGVLVGEVTIWSAEQTHRLSNHLSAPYADGWWSIETSHARWTGGNARLDFGQTLKMSGGILSLQIIAHGVQAQTAVAA